jgi:hypothetical protein
MKTQQEQIEQRRKQMPDIHRANYDKAMRGKSMKAAIKAFCLECVQWQKEEVRLCTDLGCSLYPYRPYKNKANHSDNQVGFESESQNSTAGKL